MLKKTPSDDSTLTKSMSEHWHTGKLRREVYETGSYTNLEIKFLMSLVSYPLAK